MAEWIKADGTSQEIGPMFGIKYGLDQLQALVGGPIELVHLANDKILVVNEEGLVRGLPVNKNASIRANQHIVGDALLIEAGEID